MKKIDFYKHQVDKKTIINQISKVLKNSIITSGEIGEKVEKQIAKFFKVKYCLLTNSWTNGAIATLLALQIKKGDENIWTEELPAKHIYVLPLNNKIKKRVLKNI